MILMIIPVWIVSGILLVGAIFLLIKGINQIQTAVGGSVLLKLPLTQKSAQFVLTIAGDYAIWQTGRTIQRIPVRMSTPVISALLTGETIHINPSFSSIRVNNGWEGRIQLFTFWAQAGQYQLDLINTIAQTDLKSPFFIEIRERKPGTLLVWGILLVLLGAFCLITGLTVPFVLTTA